MFETPRIYFREVFKILAIKFEFEFEFNHKDPSLVASSLPFLFLQTDQGRGKGLLEIFFWMSRDLANPFSSCRFQFGLEGKGGARGDLQNPLPLNSTSRRPKPPVKARHPAGTLAPAPPRSDSGQKPPRRPGHRHAHRGHPSRASLPPTTPRPVTSPSEPPQHLGSIP
jgi:hypothetical protein